MYGEPRWSLVEDPVLAATLRVFPRQALHAWRVAFTHPITRARVTIEAPVPRDLAALMETAGLSGPAKAGHYRDRGRSGFR
jgi:23S rRNA pseudouridine1911/1915/1917 synthase